jgi:thiamine transporter ThiT
MNRTFYPLVLLMTGIPAILSAENKTNPSEYYPHILPMTWVIAIYPVTVLCGIKHLKLTGWLWRASGLLIFMPGRLFVLLHVQVL